VLKKTLGALASILKENGTHIDNSLFVHLLVTYLIPFDHCNTKLLEKGRHAYPISGATAGAHLEARASRVPGLTKPQPVPS
jgi:hypothetical protein